MTSMSIKVNGAGDTTLSQSRSFQQELMGERRSLDLVEVGLRPDESGHEFGGESSKTDDSSNLALNKHNSTSQPVNIQAYTQHVEIQAKWKHKGRGNHSGHWQQDSFQLSRIREIRPNQLSPYDTVSFIPQVIHCNSNEYGFELLYHNNEYRVSVYVKYFDRGGKR